MRVRNFKGFRRESDRKKRGQWLFTLRGDKGKLPRRILIGVAALVLLVVILRATRADPILMASAEIATVWDNGVLRVGVRNDIPGMGEDGEGLEVELARALAERIMSANGDWTGGEAVELVEVNSMNVAVKLSDGSIDCAICLMPRGAYSSYAYSSGYLADALRIITRPGEENTTLTKETKIGYIQSSSSTSMYVPTSINYNTLNAYVEAREEEGWTAAASLYKYASYEMLFRALENGEVDVAALTGILIHKYKDVYAFGVSDIVISEFSYGVACLSDVSAIASVADVMLSDMRADGSLDALKQKYGLE